MFIPWVGAVGREGYLAYNKEVLLSDPSEIWMAVTPSMEAKGDGVYLEKKKSHLAWTEIHRLPLESCPQCSSLERARQCISFS